METSPDLIVIRRRFFAFQTIIAFSESFMHNKLEVIFMPNTRVEAVREAARHMAFPYRNFDAATCAAHLEGVASFAAMIAAKRGLDTELSSIAGLLHDAYAYRVGFYACHAHNGAEMARVLLRDMDLFTDEERFILCSAIFQHDDLEQIRNPYDEVLKDADILFPLMQNGAKQAPACRRSRIEQLFNEFGLSGFERIAFTPENQEERAADKSRRTRMADMAKMIASSPITGAREDANYLELIRYWPEESAPDELTSGWCAAFVYHMAMESGLFLPIRHPLCENRFACVHAWHEWAAIEGFYHENTPDFAPERGDIVIYDDVLPLDKKPPNSPWHDHIGVLVECEGDHLLVAEGNADGNNVTGLIPRKKNARIGGFIRVPDEYQYGDKVYTYDQCVWGRR